MLEICGDNRFEIIAQARKDIIEATNIESSEDEMKVLDNFLFRCWQMGWLDKYDDTKVDRLKLVQETVYTVMNQCKSDTNEDRMARNIARFIQNALDGSFPDFESIEEPKTGEWIPCSERLPEIDNVNEINEFDVLLAVRPKKHPERTPQVYIGKLRPVEGDDGSGNFWGVKTAPCEWTIWGWSYFQEPEVLAWMPLPKPWKGE